MAATSDRRTEHPIYEIVIERSDTAPDQGVVVFADGVRVPADQVQVVIIDVGQGHTREQWGRYRVTVEAPDLTPACRAAVSDVFNRNDNSEFIEG